MNWKLCFVAFLSLCISQVESQSQNSKDKWKALAKQIFKVVPRFGNSWSYNQENDDIMEAADEALAQMAMNYDKVPDMDCGEDILVGEVLPLPPIQGDSIYSENRNKQIRVIQDLNGNKKPCDSFQAGYGYKCVPYYQCDMNGEILTDGLGVIEIRIDSTLNGSASNHVTMDLSDKKCKSSLEVCCKNPESQGSLTSPSPTPTPTPTLTTQDYQGTNIIENIKNTSKVYQPSCGNHNSEGIHLRVSGASAGESQFAEWPHVCAVLERTNLGGQEEAFSFKCGASLILPEMVLTAAHCLNGLSGSDLVVRCGEWDSKTTNEPLPHQDRNVRKILIHPHFNKRTLVNDFGILTTEEKFVLDQHVDTVCLPELGLRNLSPENCWVSGWGKDKFGDDGEYQVIMKSVQLPLLDHSHCQKLFRKNTKLSKHFRLDPTFTCAGANGADACTGDGGGPLVCKDKESGKVVQVGIVAWGIGCGQVGVPGAYAAVEKAACWIKWAANKCGSEEYDLTFKKNCKSWLRQNSRSIRC